MCGIAGIYARGDGAVSVDRLRAMRDDQSHRGPDATGLWTAPHVGLAFNRLAIIDLSPQANQPMASADGRAWIVFNGDIYNFRVLRSELEAAGRRFRTQSDTEVILEGFLHWGLGVLPRLNGMFAFALWDTHEEILHVARDRVGKKPIFYQDAGGEVVFASEVRALVRGLGMVPPLDARSLDSFLAYMCVPAERSIYEGVRRVPPASVATFTRTGMRIERYWKLSFARKTRCSEDEAIGTIDAILEDSTRLRMISDVPIGAFLSGGVDSSAVVAMMSRVGGPVRTFSVGFAEEGMDELPFARAVADHLGTRHESIRVEPDAAAILPRLVWHYGEPFADSSAVPTYYLSAVARKGVTVALNGDGGDEGFAGYPWNRTIRAAELYRSLVPGLFRRSVLAPLGRALGRLPIPSRTARTLGRFMTLWSDRSAADVFWIWPGFKQEDRPLLYRPSFLSRLDGFDPSGLCTAAYEAADGPDDLDRGLDVVLETYLPDDLLVKVDIASMAHSLEARSPLLDYRLLEYAATLPSSLKYRRFETKRLLKKLAARLVPPHVVYRRKQGFAVPLEAWLRGPLRRPLEILLLHPRAQKRPFFEPGFVKTLIARHLAGEDHGPKLWALLWLELWFRMFVDHELKKDDSLHDL